MSTCARVLFADPSSSTPLKRYPIAFEPKTDMISLISARSPQMRDSRDRERLLNELELGLALQHPNLNSVLCWKEIDGDFHIFLKL